MSVGKVQNILTSIGDDRAACGADLRATGTRTRTRNEATCVTFVTPREAAAAGAVDHVQPLCLHPLEIKAHGLSARQVTR